MRLILLLLVLSGCTTPKSNMFCADKCEMSGGMMSDSTEYDHNKYYCTCVYTKPTP